jgi:hypothetical protein
MYVLMQCSQLTTNPAFFAACVPEVRMWSLQPTCMMGSILGTHSLGFLTL